MKKIYEKPELNIISYNVETVFTASGTFANNIYTQNDEYVDWNELF